MMMMMTTRERRMTDSSKTALANVSLRSVDKDVKTLCQMSLTSRLCLSEQPLNWSSLRSSLRSASWWSANAKTSRLAKRHSRSILFSNVLRTHTNLYCNYRKLQCHVVCLSAWPPQGRRVDRYLVVGSRPAVARAAGVRVGKRRLLQSRRRYVLQTQCQA